MPVQHDRETGRSSQLELVARETNSNQTEYDSKNQGIFFQIVYTCTNDGHNVLRLNLVLIDEFMTCLC